uniref:Protein prenyltransferase alpha subunit repeat-containing protein 1 n=1 Tax=Aegilops tauschii subsp. strangulata TaxID=200361 RepID=A0A453HSV6_AEGTS
MNSVQHDDRFTLLHLQKSKMNYRAWRHRCWLIPYMKTKQVLDELNKSKKWAELHVADNCSFHYRRSLLLALLDGAANREDSLICQSEAYLMWKEELRWNETLIRRYQGREVCACGESKVVLLLGVVTDS